MFAGSSTASGPSNPPTGGLRPPTITENQMTFEEFYKECDKIVVNILGLGIDDLPDAQWADYYHDEMSPADAVDTANIDFWDGQLPI